MGWLPLVWLSIVPLCFDDDDGKVVNDVWKLYHYHFVQSAMERSSRCVKVNDAIFLWKDNGMCK